MTAHILKAELHAHIEGTLTPAFVRQLADRHGSALPDDLFTPEGKYNWNDFFGFLKCYDLAASLIKTDQDYSDLTFDYLSRAAAENCIYVELICSGDHARNIGLSYGAMVNGIADGIDRARAASGIEARMQMSIVRHYGTEGAMQVVDEAIAAPHPYVTGLNIAGDETAHHPRDFAAAFVKAHEAGLGLTAHAGEVCGPESVNAVLDAFPGLSRIGHGVRAIEDADTIARLRDQGILLEVCPGSNVALSVFSRFEDHSLPALADAGVAVCLASDDPPFFDTTIGREYQIAADVFGYDDAGLTALTRRALEGAFVDDTTRQALLARLATQETP